MSNKLSQQRRDEMSDLLAQMTVEQLRVMAYLGRLYIARKAAPMSTIDAEIERVQREIREGHLPAVPVQ